MSLNKKLAVEISAVNGETGKWIYTTLILPATDSEIEDAMQKVRVTEGYSDYLGIDILSCPYLPELEGTKLECPTMCPPSKNGHTAPLLSFSSTAAVYIHRTCRLLHKHKEERWNG